MQQIISFLFLLLLSCKTIELEPNNSFENAHIIDSSKDIKGEIEFFDDEDFFYIKPKKNHVIDIKINNNNSKILDVYLYDKNKKLITSDTNKKDKFFRNYTAKGLYIQIMSIEKSSYSIEIKYKDKNYFEQEPNNDFKNTSSIKIDQTIDGYLNDFDNNDIFHIQHPSENIDISLSVFITHQEWFNPVLELYDLSGNLIERFNQASINEIESIENYIIKAPLNYYLRVYNKNPIIHSPIHYQLLVQTKEVVINKEYEPNNTPQTANGLSENIDQFLGYINKKNDKDYYKINFKNAIGSLFYIFVTPPDDIDVELQIVDSFDNVILSSNSSKRGSVESIQNFYIQNSTYFFRIKSDGNKSVKPYKIVYFYRKPQNNIEKEPNNTLKNASIIEINNTTKGLIGNKNDIDIFKFNINNKKKYITEIILPKNIDATLTIYEHEKEKKLATIINNKIKKTNLFFNIKNYRKNENKVTFESFFNKKWYSIKIQYLNGNTSTNEFYYIRIREKDE